MTKIVCPTCNGAGQLKDLPNVEPSLHYPEGYKLEGTAEKPRELPTDGYPALSCKTCKGQGWVAND